MLSGKDPETEGMVPRAVSSIFGGVESLKEHVNAKDHVFYSNFQDFWVSMFDTL